MATLDAVLATIDKNIDASTQRLFDFLRIPSVSTDPAYTKECERAADWLVRELQGLGYRAESRPDSRPSHRGRPCEREAQGCAASAVLRPLRRAAARSAGTVEDRALRAASATGRRDAGDRRARRLRRQGSAHDFRRGLPRLRGQWRTAVQRDLPVRGRGGDRLARRCRNFSPPTRPNCRSRRWPSSATPACGTRPRRASRSCCAGWCRRR